LQKNPDDLLDQEFHDHRYNLERLKAFLEERKRTLQRELKEDGAMSASLKALRQGPNQHLAVVTGGDMGGERMFNAGREYLPRRAVALLAFIDSHLDRINLALSIQRTRSRLAGSESSGISTLVKDVVGGEAQRLDLGRDVHDDARLTNMIFEAVRVAEAGEAAVVSEVADE